MKQEFCNLFHTIMEGYKMVNEAYIKLWHAIEDKSLQILGKILLDIYITASKQTMLAKDKPVGDSDDDDDYEYSDDDDDQKEEEETILIQKIKSGTWGIDITDSHNDPDQDSTQTEDKDAPPHD